MTVGLRTRAVAVLVVAMLAVAAAACSSSGSRASGSSTTTEPARCAAYRRMSAADRRVVDLLPKAKTDWGAVRRALIAGNAAAEVGYTAVAASATGALRDDAVRAAAFMPRSRDAAAHAASYAAYRVAVGALAGDTQVNDAVARIDADAEATCRVVIAHTAAAPSTTTSTTA